MADALNQEKELFGRTYAPAPEYPDYVKKAVTQIGGLNFYGEPKLKIVWGMDERTFRRGNPEAIKYRGPHSPRLGLDRWILEVYREASFYGTRDDWQLKRYMFDAAGNRVDLLGDYPYRGVYVMSAPICHPTTGEFLPLNEQVVDWIKSEHQKQTLRPFNIYSTLAGLRELEERTAQDEQAEMDEADREADILTDYYNTHWHALNQERAYSFGQIAHRAMGAAKSLLSQRLNSEAKTIND